MSTGEDRLPGHNEVLVSRSLSSRPQAVDPPPPLPTRRRRQQGVSLFQPPKIAVEHLYRCQNHPALVGDRLDPTGR